MWGMENAPLYVYICELQNTETFLNISNIDQIDGSDKTLNCKQSFPRVALQASQDPVSTPVVQIDNVSDITTLPLFLVLNAQSIRQKADNLKRLLETNKSAKRNMKWLTV